MSFDIKKKIFLFIIILCLVISTFSSIDAYSQNETTYCDNEKETKLLASPQIEIIKYEPGNLYLFNLEAIEIPILKALNTDCSVVINNHLKIETTSSEVHHAKFVAKRALAGWETIRWDYITLDGLSQEFDTFSTGLYEITSYAYDENNNEIGNDKVRIFYIKAGSREYGITIHTSYNGGGTISSSTDISLLEFTTMLNTGDKKTITATLQEKDDTSIKIGFNRNKILSNSEDIIETTFNVETSCDKTKDYEISVDIKFPFIVLDGGETTGFNEPFFRARVGYHSYPSENTGVNSVNTTFSFGRKNIEDPRVFQMKIKPNNYDENSKLTFFNSYETVDKTGAELFHRGFSIDFEPATELTITSIPKQAKISYDFGESQGDPTKISFRALGGKLDDIVQSFGIDPLPSFMSFDLTLLGSKEFIYESSSTYNASYSMDSNQNGNIIKLQLEEIPTSIHASCGIDLGVLGDLSAYGFADLNMSSDIKGMSLSIGGNDVSFLKVENVPKKIKIEGTVDIPNKNGNITINRDINTARTLGLGLVFDELVLNNTFELENKMLQILWDVDENNRSGNIKALRDTGTGNSKISTTIIYNDWNLSDTLKLQNDQIELFWDLQDENDNHSIIGFNTSGDEIFENTISIEKNSVEIFSLTVEVSTQENFGIEWDYDNGQISNFEWSGKLLRLSGLEISVNHPNGDFNINADVTFGEAGVFEISLNRNTAVNFVNAQTNTFKLYGDLKINANRKLNISWDLDENGEFTIYTFNQPVGNEFNLEFCFDPLQTGNYQYGFKLIGENFVQITRTIKWYSENSQLIRIWILGDLPIPGDWTLEVLWDYDWYPVPWDL